MKIGNTDTKNHFVPDTCNTVCDVTGFKVKMCDTKLRWDGFRVIPEAWNPRQPQDFPVIPWQEKVYKDAKLQEPAGLPVAFDINNWVTNV